MRKIALLVPLFSAACAPAASPDAPVVAPAIATSAPAMPPADNLTVDSAQTRIEEIYGEVRLGGLWRGKRVVVFVQRYPRSFEDMNTHVRALVSEETPAFDPPTIVESDFAVLCLLERAAPAGDVERRAIEEAIGMLRSHQPAGAAPPHCESIVRDLPRTARVSPADSQGDACRSDADCSNISVEGGRCCGNLCVDCFSAGARGTACCAPRAY